MLTLGWKASAEQFGPRELLELAVHAEQHGFDSVVVSDHFHPWRDTGGHAPFSLTWLGALGERTKRVRIGTSVLTPTFRYHPAIVAQAFATLASLYPGRVFLGVGSGEALNEVALMADEWPSPGRRQARLREAVTLMRRLWTEDYVSFEGRFYRTKEAKIFDKPDAPIPVLIAAGGPHAAELAGELGDGLIATSGKGFDLYREKLLPSFDEGARKAGRDPGSLERLIEVKVSFDRDLGRAIRACVEWSALALPAEAKAGVDDPREMERLAEDAEAIAHTRFICSNDPDEHVARIKDYVDLGFHHLVFHAPGTDQARFLELYAEEILPRLRKIS